MEDPTRPEAWMHEFVEEEAPERGAVAELQSILKGKDRRVALINGSVVSEGDDLSQHILGSRKGSAQVERQAVVGQILGHQIGADKQSGEERQHVLK